MIHIDKSKAFYQADLDEEETLATIRQERDGLMIPALSIRDRFRDWSDLGIPFNVDDLHNVLQYIQDLRDVPQVYESEGEVIWPTIPSYLLTELEKKAHS